MRSFRQCSLNQSKTAIRRDSNRNFRAAPRNKTTGAAVSIGMAAANSPTDIERRSVLVAGSSQPGPPARTYARMV
jgi:hypothetical protein